MLATVPGSRDLDRSSRRRGLWVPRREAGSCELFPEAGRSLARREKISAMMESEMPSCPLAPSAVPQASARPQSLLAIDPASAAPQNTRSARRALATSPT